MLKVGEKIPDITLPGTNGRSVRLWDLLGTRALVIYFYPKDNTSGCTVESCSFRDSYEDFVKAGADVVGISSDSVESHEGFKEKHQLPFILLSDLNSEAKRRFRVPSTLGFLPGRVTFVVDKHGIVRHTFNSQLRVKEHVKSALEIVRSLEASPQSSAAAP